MPITTESPGQHRPCYKTAITNAPAIHNPTRSKIRCPRQHHDTKRSLASTNPSRWREGATVGSWEAEIEGEERWQGRRVREAGPCRHHPPPTTTQQQCQRANQPRNLPPTTAPPAPRVLWLVTLGFGLWDNEAIFLCLGCLSNRSS